VAEIELQAVSYDWKYDVGLALLVTTYQQQVFLVTE